MKTEYSKDVDALYVKFRSENRRLDGYRGGSNN